MTSQPRAGWNTQRQSTQRAGRNIQPTNKSKKLLKIQQYPMNTTYNKSCFSGIIKIKK